MKLLGKYFIKGQIKAVTGLHIGGSKTALDIGGIDSNVIKNSNGVPYIPGSSLKGKLRAMLTKEQGSMDINEDNKTIKEIFGFPPNQKDKNGNEISSEITRLIVRDAFLKNPEKMKNKEGEFAELELDYTEGKWENTIDRKKGTAAGAGPRQIERVPAGAIFNFELVYDVYDDVLEDKNSDNEISNINYIKEIIKAMQLLEDDYIGGSGSRGYGQIKFGRLIEKEDNNEKKEDFESGIVNTIFKKISDYQSKSEGKIDSINLRTQENEKSNESNNS